ncbi:di-trans,poly-cis-decaprenylcistransferase [Patescibacteria group bacterium]|nr:di-trans,poly-cis-decaprenylcistransferase [Patescibacteria group bacterium]MBU4481645.1 di-trans,poly-cis-decaprenylcistransferase [Patescibacteria group bacterium]
MINHVAIIPDGNRRWAKRKGIAGQDGHAIGVETTQKIFEKALELKIPYTTFWAASYDNLIRRSREEVNFLTCLVSTEFQRLLKDAKINENKIKIRILGRFREIMPEKTVQIIEKLMEKTEKNNLFSRTFLLAYNGTDEMTEAVKKIARAAKESAIKITSEAIKNFLWTKDLPPVDLVIRTGCEGDPHNSAGFMMWHTTQSQYYFTKTLYPDFSPEEFQVAVQGFLKRERRFGK